LSGYCDFTVEEIDERWPLRSKLPPGPPQLIFDVEHLFVEAIPSQYENVQVALKALREKYPGKKIIQMNEAAFFGGVLPNAGAPGLRPDGILSLGIGPMALPSIDCAAFGPGILPDSSPEGRQRNIAMNAAVKDQMLGGPQKRFMEIMTSLKAELGEKNFMFETPYTLADRFLQMCIPSAEYPRSDAPPTIRFAGDMPKGESKVFEERPAWWDKVINDKTKKIVAISQGTVALDFNDLVIPALTALKDREDILLVVALGRKGLSLPVGTDVPVNSYIADYIPYDELLPHSAVFITNGGYGAFRHGISNATPLVVAGGGEDKPEVAARVEWCGLGYNLRTGQPTADDIGKAVDEVLTNPKYKKRALELQAEKESYDPLSILVATIDELANPANLDS
jgi:hypothetical protein